MSNRIKMLYGVCLLQSIFMCGQIMADDNPSSQNPQPPQIPVLVQSTNHLKAVPQPTPGYTAIKGSAYCGYPYTTGWWVGRTEPHTQSSVTLHKGDVVILHLRTPGLKGRISIENTHAERIYLGNYTVSHEGKLIFKYNLDQPQNVMNIVLHGDLNQTSKADWENKVGIYASQEIRFAEYKRGGKETENIQTTSPHEVPVPSGHIRVPGSPYCGHQYTAGWWIEGAQRGQQSQLTLQKGDTLIIHFNTSGIRGDISIEDTNADRIRFPGEYIIGDDKVIEFTYDEDTSLNVMNIVFHGSLDRQNKQIWDARVSDPDNEIQRIEIAR